MAETYYAADSAEAKQYLDEQVFRDIAYDNFFSKFMGEGAGNIVQLKRDVEKDQGDKITFTLIYDMTGDGITGTSGDSLEGNEEEIRTATMNLYLEEYAHATRDKGPLTRKRVFFSIDAEARRQLDVWGKNKVVKLGFNEIFNSRTKVIYGGDATSIATLETTDKLTPSLLSQVATAARNGWNGTYIPMRGVVVDGQEWLILLCHNDVLWDLKQNPTMQQAIREAREQGKKNPLFTGAQLMWDGVILFDHRLCPIGTNGGASGTVPYGKCVLLGAQAMCIAYGKRPEVVAEEFDYKRKHGYGISMMMKFKKSQFDGKDFAVVGIDVARTRVSDPA